MGDPTMTSKAQETASRKDSPGPEPRGGRTVAATRLGLTGPSGARRRGSLLRRMLATGDWLTMVATLCIVTAASPKTDVGTLFWATMFSPVWVLVLKLHGLYDNDHRRIRHSTLDEISSLISAAALGTLALDGLLALSPVGPLAATSAIAVGVGALLGSFASRAVLRFFWHRLAGAATGIVIGPAAAVAVVARRVAPTRRPACTWSATWRRAARTRRVGCPGSARSPTSHEWPASTVERVIVTEQEMSEPAAERMIEQCKAAGLALTFLPQHFGLLGPGIELNRLAELPVLDFRFSDPPRSTRGAEAGHGPGGGRHPAPPLLPSAAWPRTADPARLRPAGLLPPAARRQGRRAVHGAEVPHDGQGRRAAAGRTRPPREARRARFKIDDDPRVTRAGRGCGGPASTSCRS